MGRAAIAKLIGAAMPKRSDPVAFTVTRGGTAVGAAIWDGRWTWHTDDGTSAGVVVPDVRGSRRESYLASIGLPADADEGQIAWRTWCRSSLNRMELVPHPQKGQTPYVPLRLVRDLQEGDELILSHRHVVNRQGRFVAEGPLAQSLLLDMLGVTQVSAVAVNHDRHPATRGARWMARIV